MYKIYIPLCIIQLYDKENLANRLPSDRRNINIINGVKFGKILGYIQTKNKDGIESWIKEYKNTLTEYLNKNPNKWKPNDPGKYCANLNYIIDFIVQGINNLKMIEGILWALRVQEISRDTLRQYTSSKCTRNLDNYENNNLFFKKLMLDLCEDIEYFEKKKNILKNNNCLKFISRLKYREKILMDFFYTIRNESVFDLNHECSISFIHKNLSNINCNKLEEQANTIGASEEARVTASSSVHRADPQLEKRMIEPPDKEVSETEVLQDPSHDDGLDNSEQVHTFPDDLKFSLPVKEDAPKLDTTYAAASLAGISLFGTILYKVKYHRIIEILCAIFIFYVI
ncbi:hypothetical protein PVBG_06240 [Plasmodium vivax Brazil I]|uniref:Pv-fam-c protein n=1 Tax=Plasmodium vivax (strain Brazil I) TaxID=1033975 RepID=A0A0J9SK91_PLAV1|nr:hypothetical protein PVBG_06240 [Plasmodium vivax Brazil I]